MLSLARPQAVRGRSGRALATLDRALASYPEDRDLRLWKARVLYWSGELDEAWALVRLLPYTGAENEETARLRADLAFARGDWDQAQYGYQLVWGAGGTEAKIRRNHALSSLAMGDEDTARYNFAGMAGRGDPEGLALLRRHSRWRASLEPSVVTGVAGEGGWQLSGSLDHRLEGRELWLGGRVEQRQRWFDGVPAADTWLEGHGSWAHASGLLIAGSAGATPLPDFAPVAGAWVEPGWSIRPLGLELKARAWQLWFSESRATVLSPAALLELGPFSLYARGYYTLDDRDEPGLSALGRVGVSPVARLHLHALGGLGNRADYLQPRELGVQASWVVGGGVSIDLSPYHSVTLDGLQRHEQTATEARDEVQLTLGSRWAF